LLLRAGINPAPTLILKVASSLSIAIFHAILKQLQRGQVHV
jgi:hypothetical protein